MKTRRSTVPMVSASLRGLGKAKRKAVGGNPTPPPPGDPEGAGPTKRRKERDPNWSREEILALVEAKREEYLEEMEVLDARDLMATDISKWRRIAEKVNAIT